MTKMEAHLWIHGWSLLHGATATITAQSPDSGFLLLSGETVTAVAVFSKLCGAKWSRAFVESFVKQAMANRVGTEIARQTAGKIPGIGNLYNGLTSLGLTELILWDTYHHCCEQGRKKESAYKMSMNAV